MSELVTSYTCPHCKQESLSSEWTASEPYCEDCGSHTAVRCPKCDEDVDPIWYREFELLTDFLHYGHAI